MVSRSVLVSSSSLPTFSLISVDHTQLVVHPSPFFNQFSRLSSRHLLPSGFFLFPPSGWLIFFFFSLSLAHLELSQVAQPEFLLSYTHTHSSCDLSRLFPFFLRPLSLLFNSNKFKNYPRLRWTINHWPPPPPPGSAWETLVNKNKNRNRFNVP